MGDIFGLIYIFLHKYLAPFLFVIGLLFFIYGCIEYFIIGLGGDEERAQHGRELLLRSISWFVVAIIVYIIIASLGWLGSFAKDSGGSLQTPRAGVNVEQNERTLTVPNVPRENVD